jgi:diaminobutyrate-2-oxoglutarate transaminase
MNNQDPLDYLSGVESSARTYASSFPRMFTSAKGVRVRDSEGREYIDCLSNAGTLALGHNHPEVKDAVRAFLDSDHLQQALDLATPAKYAFVKQLFSLLPDDLRAHGKIQFCGPTGADAVEAAMKLAKHHTDRPGILAFQGGYHGMTAGALAAMGNLRPKTSQWLSGVHFMPYPYAFRCPFGTDGSQTDKLSIDYIRNVLSDPESGVTRPAAIIVEVVQGEGGCIPASAHWLRELRQITQQHGVLLIVDEVQTGFGRTGHMFAIQDAGIVPDALVLSKAIGGGYPMSVVVYHRRLDTWLPGMHAGTFRGNQIGMVAGQVTMHVIQRDGLASQAARHGELLMAGLRRIARDFPFLAEVRGRGLMVGVEVADVDSAVRPAPADAALAKAIRTQCFEQGLIVETGGRHGAVLRFLPPLIISESDVGAILDRFENSIRKVRGMSQQKVLEPVT